MNVINNIKTQLKSNKRIAIPLLIILLSSIGAALTLITWSFTVSGFLGLGLLFGFSLVGAIIAFTMLR